MLARLVLSALAFAAIAWSAFDLASVVAYRQARRVVYASHKLSPAEVARARGLLRRASAATPDAAPRVDGVVLSYQLGRLRDAERRAGAIVRGEPANTAAWSWLLAATRKIDPARAQAARAALARLDPKAGAPLGR